VVTLPLDFFPIAPARGEGALLPVLVHKQRLATRPEQVQLHRQQLQLTP
jgi:hypothetical protein